MKTIALSAIIVTGLCRNRAQKALDALCRQTMIQQMEIIIVDLGAAESKPFTYAEDIRISIVPMPIDTSWASARMAAVKKANGEIVAFIEDHSFARPDWSEHLIHAFETPWAAVGYSIVNANPDTYVSRAGFVSDYILWMSPVHAGKAELLPGNNVAYRRSLLVQFGEQLEIDLGIDFNIQEALRKQGHVLAMSDKAMIAHQNHDRIGGLIRANYHYCKLLAANRASSQNWRFFRRAAYIIGTPFGAPIIKMVRIILSLRNRQALVWPFVSALPVILVNFIVSAIGESLGYLVGAGRSVADFNKWELMQQRTKDL